MKATGLGSLPGTDMRAAIGVTLQDFSHAYLPELPARGVGADMVGRTAALLDLGIDLQPDGWRLTGRRGVDAGRAYSWLRSDLDDLEELAQGFDADLTVSMAGPATLWASLLRPRLDRVLADHGARREVAEALGVAAREHVADVAHRLPAARLWLKLDDPLADAVLAGQVATLSGFSRHRAVTADELRGAIRGVVDAVGDTPVVVHSCGDFPFAAARGSGVAAVSLDVTRPFDVDRLAALVDDGAAAWLGALPTHVPNRVAPVRRVVDAAWGQIERLGEGLITDQFRLTPACGLATWRPDAAASALRTVRDAADEVCGRLD